MAEKMSVIEQLLLVNIYTLWRPSLSDLSETFWHSKSVLRKWLPTLEKRWYIISFNIGKAWVGTQKVSYYKLYAIHFNYIETMKQYVATATFRNPDWSVHAELQWGNDVRVFFVLDNDKYEWSPEMRCLLKNGKPMDTRENVQKEMGVRMRSKKGTWKTLRLPDGASDEQIETIKAQNWKVKQDIAKDSFNNNK